MLGRASASGGLTEATARAAGASLRDLNASTAAKRGLGRSSSFGISADRERVTLGGGRSIAAAGRAGWATRSSWSTESVDAVAEVGLGGACGDSDCLVPSVASVVDGSGERAAAV